MSKNYSATEETSAVRLVSKIAIFTCCLMYISYIFQIIDNLSGHPTSPLQPAVATVNAMLWVYYGVFKRNRDWAIIIANIPGVIFGFLTFITCFIH